MPGTVAQACGAAAGNGFVCRVVDYAQCGSNVEPLAVAEDRRAIDHRCQLSHVARP